MSEPIKLHDGAGNVLTVYSQAQAEKLLRGGQWYATEADAKAAHPAPRVTTGAVVSSGEGETKPPPAVPVKRPSKGKAV